MNEKIQPGSRTIIETILVLILLLGLLLALYDVLKFFFGVLTFALIFSVSFYAPFEKLVRLFKNKRKLAAFFYAILLTAFIALPVFYIISALRGHLKELITATSEIKTNGLPPLPAWISRAPFIGAKINSFWLELQNSPKEVIALHEEQIKEGLRHVLRSGAGMFGTVIQFIAGIFISAFFLASGEKMLVPVQSAMQHLLGKRDGLSLLVATAHAIKSVSIGVMGTALIAAFISWIGLTIAGVSFALGIAALVFFLVLIQLGPLLVWIPLVIVTVMQGHTGMAVFLTIYGIGLLLIDALLKPYLIARSGGKLPFLVLFLGVIGGLAAWGFTGMFKGAIIVAIFYTVFTSWLEKKDDTVAEKLQP